MRPRFGDKVRGIYAGESNPLRDGFFVKVVDRRRCKTNNGVFYQLTDGKGRFWEYPDYSVVILESMFAAAGTAATALAEAGYDAVEVFRALSEIIEEWRCKIAMIDSVASRVVTKESHDLLLRIKGE